MGAAFPTVLVAMLAVGAAPGVLRLSEHVELTKHEIRAWNYFGRTVAIRRDDVARVERKRSRSFGMKREISIHGRGRERIVITERLDRIDELLRQIEQAVPVSQATGV
jgi:hypothetical protein